MRTLQRLVQTRTLLLTICAAGIGGTFQFGYNLSIINAPTTPIQEFINGTWQARMGRAPAERLLLLVWSAIVSLYPLGGLLGALLSGPLAVVLGRELLGAPQAWPLLLASCSVPSVLQLLSLPLLPESPRYLLIDRGDTVACLAALRRLRGSADVATELAELQEERAACGGARARRPWELLGDRARRRQVLTLGVLGSAMALCGNDTVYAYASAVFLEARVPPDKVQYAIVGTGSCELLTSCVSCVVIERVGRRLLLIGGYSLMACWGSVFTVALCLQGAWPGASYLAMCCVFAFILSFGIGPAGVTGILATELFDQMSRPAASMVLGAMLWFMLFLVGLVFPFLMEGLSQFLYAPFVCVCVGAALYTGFFLPETKGKTLLEISGGLQRASASGERGQGAPWTGPGIILSTEL